MYDDDEKQDYDTFNQYGIEVKYKKKYAEVPYDRSDTYYIKDKFFVIKDKINKRQTKTTKYELNIENKIRKEAEQNNFKVVPYRTVYITHCALCNKELINEYHKKRKYCSSKCKSRHYYLTKEKHGNR